MNIFQILTPLIYWLLVATWAYILFFLMRRLRFRRFERSLINTLIIILAIDAFRTLLESIYFGARFTSLLGFLPIGVHDFLVRPEMVFIPKLLNVIAAALIIGILLYRWFPAEKRDRELLESKIKENTNELGKRNEQLRYEITERTQAEEALRIERDNLNNIFQAMEDGVYIVNKNYDIQYVNPVLKKDFGGYEGIKCYAYFHDREEVCPWCKNSDVFAGKTVHWEWVSSKNGKTYDLIDTPLKNPDGSILKLEIFRDITERKQTEEELAKHREHLEGLVKDRTAELEKKNAELKRFNKLFLGREIRIKELKDKIKELEKRKV